MLTVLVVGCVSGVVAAIVGVGRIGVGGGVVMASRIVVGVVRGCVGGVDCYADMCGDLVGIGGVVSVMYCGRLSVCVWGC